MNPFKTTKAMAPGHSRWMLSFRTASPRRPKRHSAGCENICIYVYFQPPACFRISTSGTIRSFTLNHQYWHTSPNGKSRIKRIIGILWKSECRRRYENKFSFRVIPYIFHANVDISKPIQVIRYFSYNMAPFLFNPLNSEFIYLTCPPIGINGVLKRLTPMD